MNDLEMVPVVITFVFTFHMLCISIVSPLLLLLLLFFMMMMMMMMTTT